MLPIQTKLDRIPPWAYRLLAKDNCRPLTTREIAERGGLTRKWVEKLSKLNSFAAISVSTADRYIHGCGFNPFKQRQLVIRLKRIMVSKQGLAGVRHLHPSARLSGIEKSHRIVRLHRLAKLLTDEKGKQPNIRSGPRRRKPATGEGAAVQS